MTVATNTPIRRRGLAELARTVRAFGRARFQLRGAHQGAHVRSYGRLVVPQRVGIHVGERSTFLGGPIATELRCRVGANLVVGSRSVFNYGVSIIAERDVRIGAECMIASLVTVRDDDGRRSAPVVIGDNVWIAYGAVIEPGSTIGDGAVIGTMAVVSGSVPPRSLAIGNPARCLPLESAPAILAPTAEAPRLTGAARLHHPDDVRRAIVDWLDDTRHFGAAASLIRDDSTSLRTMGLLDSLGVVQLVSMLEERFRVAIDRDRVPNADHQSMTGFISLVTHAAGGLT
jgi:maltose O-acetyltransferase